MEQKLNLNAVKIIPVRDDGGLTVEMVKWSVSGYFLKVELTKCADRLVVEHERKRNQGWHKIFA